MKHWIPILFVVACITALPTIAKAATVYVNSSTGNDTTGNGTSGNPYQTFNQGYTVAIAGDTLDLTGTFDWSNSAETGDATTSGYTFTKNLTVQGQGAGVTFIQASSTENTADRRVFTIGTGRTITIKNLTMRYGVSTATESGGAITNSGNLTIQSAALKYNRFNSTTNSYGAAAIELPNDANSTLTIATSTIAYNSYNGRYYGSGGIFAGQTNTISITASTFHNNHATSSDPATFAFSYADPSGAIGVFRFVTTTVTNSTFTNNSTNSYGGALQIYYPNSYKITNSTIANNTASLGAGGILFESVTNGYNIHMKNTILANNTANGSPSDFHAFDASSGGRVTDNGYNIVEYSTNKTWSATGDITGDQASLNVSSTLADNSATNGVQTLALSSGSVAINAGNATAHSSIAIPGTDQRGGTRNSTVDIGAFEYGAGGLVDITAPTVSQTAPSTGGAVGGASVALTATASDDIAIAGVSFYVDSTLQGSEDTSSPYSITWNSTATSTGSHTAFVVARDSSNNYATSSSVSFTVDNVNPTLSSVSSSALTSSATITWSSNESTSSKVNFGITSSYGTSTTETDTSPRVTSHSVSLSGLVACTLYHYQAQGADTAGNTGTSTDGTFTSTGCTGSASVTSTEQSSITTVAGGTVTHGVLSLTVPVSFTATSSSAVFQINKLDNTAFRASAGAPSGVSQVGSATFSLKSFTDATTTLETFASPITVTLSYTASDVAGITESSLQIYRYDGSSWSALSSCSVNTSAKTVSCTTTRFSEFSLFGQVAQAASVSTSSGGGFFVIVEPRAQPGSEKLDFTINNGESVTATPTLSLAFNADPVAVRGYSVSLDPTFAHDSIYSYKDSVEYSLPDVPGTYRVYARYYSTSVHASPVYSHVIEYKKMSTEKAPQKTTLEILFTRNLSRGVAGDDVRRLQEYLNSRGFLIAVSGYGSPGNETTHFGSLTQEALIKFQKASGIDPAMGYFGPITRSVIAR